MINIGIDEMTIIVMSSNTNAAIRDWPNEAKRIIHQIEQCLKLEEVFGSAVWSGVSLPKGYDNGRLYYNSNSYFSIAYNTGRQDMGIVIKFSSSALFDYKNHFGYNNSMVVCSIIQELCSLGHPLHCSRIDLFVDYINEDVSVDEIYKSLRNGSVFPAYFDGQKNCSKINSIHNEDVVNTIYIGSETKNTRCRLRIYNKKYEQESKYGSLYHEAVEYDSWVRFEVMFKQGYAKELTEKIKFCISEVELGTIILSAITGKYSFFRSDSNHSIELERYSKQLQDMLSDRDFLFSNLSPRNHSLSKSYNYIINGSGILSFLYKVEKIWGKEGIRYFLDRLFSEYDSYDVTLDVANWIKRFANDYKGIPIQDVLK